MSVIKCHQQFWAAAKCREHRMQACLREGWKCIFEPGTQGKMQRTHPRNEDPYAT